MSALLAISEYSSDSEIEGECQHNKNRSAKLPHPDLSQVVINKVTIDHIDNPEQHEGRIRSFPHIRGNWASFVYITYPTSTSIIKLIQKISDVLSEVGTFTQSEDLHISLSRTFVLKYHWINPFVDSLTIYLQNLESFELEFESVRVYCNEEKTRTFVALEVKHYSDKYLRALTEQIDKALEAYSLPKFYEDPSYHMSILWIEGNKEKEISKVIDRIYLLLTSQTDDESDLKLLHVNKIYCNIGNKTYQFPLD